MSVNKTVKKSPRKFTPPAPEDAPVSANETDVVLTVNGKPIPDEWAHAINYAMTDQGIAEAKTRADQSGRPMVKVIADAWDKGIQRKSEAEPWDSFDPLREAVDHVTEPGFTYRALSPRVCDKRGLRGWEPVLDKNGKQAKVGNLFLGRMPVERKEKRNAHYRQLSEDALRDAEEQYAMDQEKLVKDAGVGGLAPLRVGEHVRDRENPDLATSIGIKTTRGELGAEG